jgi:Transposase and inactivated derivatives
LSNRLSFYILQELKKTKSIKEVASATNVSSNTVMRLFKYVNYGTPKLPNVLSIDEFKGNTDEGKYQCILVDVEKKKVIDILPDRKQSHLINYFTKYPRQERKSVKFFVCDMWQPYTDIAKILFPNAKIIIDKYHFIRQVTWAIENVRKRLQKSMTTDVRRYYKRSRKLILTRNQKLSEDNKKALEIMLLYNDDLRLAYHLKEWFYEICQSDDFDNQKKEFNNWIKDASSCGITEFETCAKTYIHWHEEILNAFKYQFTNGPTEGFNNKIKVLKRISYGVRNFDRFRNRILHCLN